MTLKNLNLPIALNTSKDDLIENFFVPLLQNSITYDRGVGYFSSSWIRENFIGMGAFAKNGGKARWITSPILSQDDWDALYLGNKAIEDETLKQALHRAIDELYTSLKFETLLALAWMIADGIVEFKLAKPRNKLANEYHAKIGIFTDFDGNSVSFDGSYNDSITGLSNYESIKVFRSWDHSAEYVEQEKELFDNIWENKDPNIAVFNIPDAAKAHILELRENSDRPYPKPDWVNFNSFNNSINIDIPVPTSPTNLNLRDYQEEAITQWFLNHNHGILEMATGTGKTITALSAVIRVLGEKDRIFTIVICPYIHLAQQWLDEAYKFSFRPLVIAESQNSWIGDLSKLARDFRAKRISQGMIITTNTSFLLSALRSILEEYKIWDEALLIADEMHHCGTEEMLRILPKEIPYRLGLSATPIRSYDEVGSDKLLDYFGDIIFTFGLKDAIAQGFLTPYYYFPHPVYLQNEEFDEYVKLTKKLLRLHSDQNSPISEAALKIAIKRARVLNNSFSKVEWLDRNIESSDDISHTLFYVGDRIISDVLSLLGNKKQLLIHEFTHRQNRRERKELIEKFAVGTIQAFVAMKCLDEGVDVPPTRTAYFLASSSVSREFIQRRGRILRNYPGKKYATIIDLIAIPPIEFINLGKNSDDYKSVRSAIRREYTRVREFASLAENKHQSLDNFLDIADRFDLLDI